MIRQFLKVGDILIHTDRILAINLNAKWPAVTESGQDEDAGFVAKATENREGIEIITDIETNVLTPRDFGLDDSVRLGLWLKLQIPHDTAVARELLEYLQNPKG